MCSSTRNTTQVYLPPPRLKQVQDDNPHTRTHLAEVGGDGGQGAHDTAQGRVQRKTHHDGHKKHEQELMPLNALQEY